jgi:hypothetical protein
MERNRQERNPCAGDAGRSETFRRWDEEYAYQRLKANEKIREARRRLEAGRLADEIPNG